MRMRLHMPLTREGARPRAPRKGVDSSIYRIARPKTLSRLRRKRIARTRSLPATKGDHPLT